MCFAWIYVAAMPMIRCGLLRGRQALYIIHHQWRMYILMRWHDLTYHGRLKWEVMIVLHRARIV
jgi:hypothetical protein